MQFLLSFLGSGLTRVFSFIATKYGFQVAVNAAFITMWLALIASLTAAANTCLSPVSGACGAVAAAWTTLPEMAKFGMSLIPTELVTFCGCLVSLHLSGWCAVVLGRILRVKSGMNTRDLTVI
ncbi:MULTISPECIES: hypothetical protein [Methylomonas]|uniref:hypothetical protein n=1 Tax=Methylomonas TaxID=416 RepID=UPI000A503ECB|nr:hypothetical protein [Methylomonas koyamae]NJA06334.1 hypothetical protein [Methylococcaceae bacterium WWC4]